MQAVVIGTQEIVANGGIEFRQRAPWRCYGFPLAEISREVGETFRIQCPEEPLNFPPALRPPDRGIDQLETQVCRDLIEMGAGEITTMIDVQDIRDAADRPRGVLLAPTCLT